MIKFIVGIFLLIAPFSLVGFFKDKKRGFIYVLFFLIVFHTLLAVFTQLFGIFYYEVILWANLICVLAILANQIFSAARPLQWGFPSPRKNLLARIDWVILLVAIISVATLYQVHYNYTGKFNTANDVLFQYHEAKNMQYIYPYFSDEWYAVSLVKESINNHSLPLKNPFDNSFFLNPEMFFHSFIAETMLFLGLDPLTQYTALSIFMNALIILLAYLFLRLSNVSKPAAAIASLSILYITSASNLPGIWNLIPVTIGVILSLLGFCFLSAEDLARSDCAILLRSRSGQLLLALLAGVFVLLFYPPLIIFYLIGFLVYLFNLPKMKDKIFAWVKYAIFLFSAALIFYIVLMISPLSGALTYILSNLFYHSYTGDFMPQFSFYYIIPWPVILLAIFGLYHVFKNKNWLFYQFILGIVFWVFYAFSNFRIIIGYERVVFFTSILVVLISGFGIEEIKKYLSLKFEKIKPVFKYIEAGAVIIFLFFIPFYTQGETWRKLILRNNLIQADSIPMAPANNYLTDEDFRIFKDIKHKKFFSIPWKGTVIGIATDNYPVVTKGGTITMDPKNPIIYQQFMSFDCNKKLQIAKEKNIDYIYSTAFLCDNFQKLDESNEGFILYKFLK